ncbi:hypothetical protein DFH06DRAFT_1005162 [Mycena polygramma]|nr:hypothetical protein DFH06DRAFT_1005162 [Mycena polygramma]
MRTESVSVSDPSESTTAVSPTPPDTDAPPAVIAPPPRSQAPPLPPKAPDWFVKAREQMLQKDLGAHYNAAVAAWTRIETACKFSDSGSKLSAKKRPGEIATWITAARWMRGQPTPVPTDPERFEREFWEWWGTLQPTWRQKDGAGNWVITEEYGGEWEDALLHWGMNGTLSVIAALCFWGSAAVDSPEHRTRWEEAVNDVAWILEGLAVFHERFGHR